MGKIAVLIDESFEDVEYEAPAKAFREAGHSLLHLSIKKGAQLKGKKGSSTVTVDMEVGSADPSSFDALFIPGGYSPDRLRAHSEPVVFVRAFVESAKPVLLICHAPQLLITAHVLQGRKITGWKSIIQDIKNAGAEFVDSPVVIDGNLISSRGPKDIAEFIKASLDILNKKS